MLVIPKTLATNAAKDSTELVAKLRAYHNISQTSGPEDAKKQLKYFGLDLENGQVSDCVQRGVLEPLMGKIRMLKSALEACTALLRIDELSGFEKLCADLWAQSKLMQQRFLIVESSYRRKNVVVGVKMDMIIVNAIKNHTSPAEFNPLPPIS